MSFRRSHLIRLNLHTTAKAELIRCIYGLTLHYHQWKSHSHTTPRGGCLRGPTIFTKPVMRTLTMATSRKYFIPRLTMVAKVSEEKIILLIHANDFLQV